MRHVRPKIVFEQMERRFPGENLLLELLLPSSAIGSLRLLESAVLISLLRLRGAKRIFEFGTFLGATSVVLAMNSPADAAVITLDIPADELARVNRSSAGERASTENDNLLRETSADQGPVCILQADGEIRSKIRCLLHNSLTLDVEAMGFSGKFEYLFIDGGHDYRTIASDTGKALAMAAPDPVIIWHDYNSPTHSDVTRYVDAFSADHPVVHVEDTMVAFHWKAFSDALG